MAKPRRQPPFPSPLLEQLAGYLVGRDGRVVRTDIRFPLRWQQFGTLPSTSRFWIRHFFEEGWRHRLFVASPPYITQPILLPLEPGAGCAADFWDEVLLLMNALAMNDSQSVAVLRGRLWEVAHDWEQHWNNMLAQIAKHSDYDADDCAAVCAADRAWASVVRAHLEPHGYVMMARSTARLL